MLKLARLFIKLLSIHGNAKAIFFVFISLSVLVAISEIALISLVAELFSDDSESTFSNIVLAFSNFGISGGVLIIIVAIAVFILRIFLITWTGKITFTSGARLISFIFNQLIHKNLNYFGQDDKSRHVAFLVSKIELVIHTLVLPFLNLASGGIISLIFLLFISYISPSLSLLAACVALIAYGIPVLISKNILKRVSTILSLDVASQVHNIKTSFEGFRDIKIWGIESYFIKQVNEKSSNVANARKTSFIWSLVPRSVIEAIIFISIGIFLVFSSNLELSNQSNVVFITFFLALLKVLPSFQQTYYSWQNLRAGSDVSSELEEYFNNNYSAIKKNTRKIEPFDSLRLNNVTFSYSNNKNILENFSFKINKNEKIAIFGESGCGKSTLLDIIAGIYTPQKGDIYINDELIGVDYLNPYISYISQEPFLFDMSIKENVTLSFATGSEIDYERLKEVLKISGVKKYMDENNISIEYLIGEGGASLSGGQAQRIAIARALYSSKELILLDEAASALDSTTRDLIISELLNLEVAIMLITHDENIFKKFPKRLNFKTKLYEN